ncbi:hypothetical protein [Deinococcus aquaedulcis]|uniref:hypothetical protein n=1 Tax=Deinococcus aquaedulcis TaxID=2840455 RepID=UPI001C83EFD2|nr:hypothetical protein [Deinococcus aquaedulcis]
MIGLLERALLGMSTDGRRPAPGCLLSDVGFSVLHHTVEEALKDRLICAAAGDGGKGWLGRRTEGPCLESAPAPFLGMPAAHSEHLPGFARRNSRGTSASLSTNS